MGDPYINVTVNNFNTDPPPDDGSQTAANEIEWAKHVNKLATPLKTAIEAIDTNIDAALAKIIGGGGVTSVGTNYTVQTSDQGKLVRATNSGITITTPDAASVTSPFVFALLNDSGGDITFDGSGAQTIDGFDSLTISDKSGFLVFTDSSNWFTTGRAPTLSAWRGHLAGLTLANNSTDSDHDIDIAVGVAMADDQSAFLELTSGLTKQIDASWAVGTDQGGLDGTESTPGAPDADTWYHVWLIRRSDTGVVDALFSESASSPTMPTDYDQKRRIGAVFSGGSANIRAFHQTGDKFIWDIIEADANLTGSGLTTRFNTTLTVPTGLVVTAVFNSYVQDVSPSSSTFVLHTSPEQIDTAPGAGASTYGVVNTGASNTSAAAGNVQIETSTSAQISTRLSNSSADHTLRLNTVGWIDRRGRDD